MGHPPATHCRSGRGWQTIGTQGRVTRRRAAAGAQGEITSHEIVATLERGRKAALASMPGTEQLSARPGLTRHQTAPTSEWIARQIIEAFPWDEAPHYLIRDRDSSYGVIVRKRIRAMGIRDRPTAPRSPWQNGHTERLIGSIRRECLDHVLVMGDAHLRRILSAYADYYNRVRTHLALNKDAPLGRRAQAIGSLAAIPLLGGLHHEYVRMS